MGAEIERHANRNICELLRRVNRGFWTNDNRRIGDDRAAADLAASFASFLNATVVAPLARVVHVGLAHLKHLAVAQKGIEPLGRDNVGGDALMIDALVAIRPSDLQAFLFKETLVIGDRKSTRL